MNLASFIAGVVKAPLTALIAAITPHASPAAQPAVAAAAANPTVETAEAAIEAVFDPMVTSFIAGAANSIPILGPIFAGEAEAVAVSAEHAALAYLIGKLQGFLPKT